MTPLNNIIAAQSGATAPAMLAGMLASTLTEHSPEYLSPAVDQQMRERYRILL